jgi:hypothetical protein
MRQWGQMRRMRHLIKTDLSGCQMFSFPVLIRQFIPNFARRRAVLTRALACNFFREPCLIYSQEGVRREDRTPLRAGELRAEFAVWISTCLVPYKYRV